MKPDQVLDAAADKIERDGWCQRVPYSPTSSKTCIVGAMDAVMSARGFWTRDDCDIQWNAAIAAMYAAVGTRPERWNDTPGRTKEEVISMLRAVAATLRAADNEGTRQQQPVAEEVI